MLCESKTMIFCSVEYMVHLCVANCKIRMGVAILRLCFEFTCGTDGSRQKSKVVREFQLLERTATCVSI